MNAKEVIVLVSALTVAGCSDPVHYSTPALDPGELALSSPDHPAEVPAPKQETKR